MQDLLFRPAIASDLPDIVAMLADDKLGQQREDVSVPISAAYVEAFAAVDRDQNQCLTVVDVAGELAGCLQLTLIPGLSRRGMWRGQVESVRIASNFRGQGLGRKMFEWVINECRARGCGLVQLTTDKSRTRARTFYESLGFEASHDGMKRSL